MEDFILPRSYDRERNPDALGVAWGRDIAAIALVSKVGPSNLWLYVQEGSGVVAHLPFAKEKASFFGLGFAIKKAARALQRQYDDAPIGVYSESDKHRLLAAWNWTQKHTASFFGRVSGVAGENPKSLAAVCAHFWNADEDEDQTVKQAVLSGLVAAGLVDELNQEREYREQEKRAEEVSRQCELDAIKRGELMRVRLIDSHTSMSPVVTLSIISAKHLISIGAAEPCDTNASR